MNANQDNTANPAVNWRQIQGSLGRPSNVHRQNSLKLLFLNILWYVVLKTIFRFFEQFFQLDFGSDMRILTQHTTLFTIDYINKKVAMQKKCIIFRFTYPTGMI